MPLHDHPNMTVFRYKKLSNLSKLIEGEFLVSSYEFVRDGNNNITKTTDDGKKIVKTYKSTRIINGGTPNTVMILKPTSGPTLHSFRCISKTAVFMDILGPPYNDTDRNCTYYEDESDLGAVEIPTTHADKTETWLTIAPHLDFPCFSRPYDLKNAKINI